MKIKKGFVLRDLAGQYVVVPVGAASKKFNGIIYLNETGSFLFNELQVNLTEEELVSKLLGEYDIDEATAKSDVKEFIENLRKAKLLDEYSNH